MRLQSAPGRNRTADLLEGVGVGSSVQSEKRLAPMGAERENAPKNAQTDITYGKRTANGLLRLHTPLVRVILRDPRPAACLLFLLLTACGKDAPTAPKAAPVAGPCRATLTR